MIGARAWALRLIDNGISVTPVTARTRAAYLPGWPEYAYRLPTEELVETWFLTCANVSIGVPCGRIIAIDIDADDVGVAHRIVAIAMRILGPTELARGIWAAG